MASTLDIVVATERHLVHHQREPRNRLAAAYTSGGTTLTLEFPTPVPARGQQVAVDFEVFEVWNVSNQEVTVEGEQEGSDAADHDEGAHVVLSPKFPRNTILAAINDTLRDLSSPLRGLFAIAELPITYQAGVYAYDLDDDFLDVVEVSWIPVASTKQPRVLLPHEWKVDRGQDTSIFPSGNSLTLIPGIMDGYSVRVKYATDFEAITRSTANVSTTSGLNENALDILDLAAAVRLLAPLEPSRNYTDSQGDTRRAEEVPPGAQDRSVRALLALRDDRIKAEAARLRKLYPMVRR